MHIMRISSSSPMPEPISPMPDISGMPDPIIIVAHIMNGSSQPSGMPSSSLESSIMPQQYSIRAMASLSRQHS